MTIHDVAGAPAESEGGVTQADPRRAPSELEALRREIERWHVLAGGDRGLLEALLHHSPHGIIVCDSAGKFVLQNRAAERIWAGSATIHGVQGWGQYRAFHPDGRAYAAEDWSMARCLSRREIVEAEEVHFQRFDGTHGVLLGSCSPIFSAKGELEGALSVFADISALKEAEERMERARAQWAARTERLLRITAALADAVTPEQVTEAVVNHTAAVLGASSCALWLVSDDTRTAVMARQVGYEQEHEAAYRRLPIGERGRFPVLDALALGEPLWLGSPEDFAARYPGVARDARPELTHSVACLPMTVEGRTIGALALTYAEGSSPAEEDRSVLQIVAQHCAQAVERVRVLRQAQLAYAETELLYRLTDAVNRAQSKGAVFDASLDTIKSALGVERAAVLLVGADGIMRFEAWRGLSEGYRSAAAGHTPWGPESRDPQPIFIEDAARDEHVRQLADRLREEGIGALAFVPLVYEGRLLGKFMLYWTAPRSFSERERSVARSIGDQVASAVGRKRAQEEREKLIEQLSQTVRLNELFVGVVGHDLRNPLSAIMNTAQLALRRDEGGRMFKPLSRILSASERMTRMIEQLLDFTRARVGGGILLDPSEMDLGALGRQLLAEIEDAHAERAIVVETIGNLEGVWDPDRLAQVVSNLAGNAVSHGTSAAPVRVVLDGSRPDVVIIRISNDGTVRPEMLPVLFEPFRGTSMRKDQTRGLGLGLYITQQIVLAHGGTVTVTSSAGEGTTFTVTLPRRAPVRTPAGGIAAVKKE